MFKFACEAGVRRLPGQPRANDFVRPWLGTLGVGQELTHVEWGTRKPKYLLRDCRQAARQDYPNEQLKVQGRSQFGARDLKGHITHGLVS